MKTIKEKAREWFSKNKYKNNGYIDAHWMSADEYFIECLTDFALSLQTDTPTDAEIDKEIRTHSTPTSEQWDIGFRSGAKWMRSRIGDGWVSVAKIEERIAQYKNVHTVLKANYEKNKDKVTQELMDIYIEIIEALESLLPNPPKTEK